ncbi:hypothetical protein P9112_011887 [Eukaryota sp. TZLM1-RC]
MLLLLLLCASLSFSEIHLLTLNSTLTTKYSPRSSVNYAVESPDPSIIQLIVSLQNTSHLSSLLSDPNIVLGDYIPVNSFLLFLRSSSSLTSLQSNDRIKYLMEFGPSLRVSPELRSRTLAATQHDSSSVSINVVLVPHSIRGKTVQEIAQSLSEMIYLSDVNVISRDRLTVQTLTKHLSSTIDSLSKNSFVHWLELSPTLFTNNNQGTVLSFGSSDDLTKFYQSGLNGEGEVVGVSDTGLDRHSCYFRDDHHQFPFDSINTNHRKVVTYRTLGDDEDNPDGHGTHVGGTLAGDSSPFNESNDHNGIAFGAKIAFTDIARGSLLVDPSDLYNNLFLSHYEEVNVKVYSNSWGTTAPLYTSHSRDADSFAWDHKDFLAVFAAGNEGRSGYNTLGAPANAKNVLTVGATGTSTEGHLEACCAGNTCCGDYDRMKQSPFRFSYENLATYSSKGPTLDLRIKPDILGIGGPLGSAQSLDTSSDHCSGPVYFQGTSMATPLVAGAAVICRQYFIKGLYNETSFSPSSALIKSVLVIGSVNVDQDADMINIPSIPSSAQGNGRLNLTRSLPLSNSHFLWVVDSNHSFSSSGVGLDYFIRMDEVNQDFPIKVALTWVDPPASLSATFTLVNDLDLIVVDPDYNLYYGNMGHYHDVLNNQEIVVPSATVGVYRLRVFASRLAVQPQPFALAFTGFKGEVVNTNDPIVEDFLSQCPLNCSNHGSCGSNGLCQCNEGYTGFACELSNCHNSCNSGVCEGNQCDCHPGFDSQFDCSIGFCRDVVTLEALNFTISDHSGPEGLGTYLSNMNCGWIISPNVPQDYRIVIEFSKLDTEEGFDFVAIYDGNSRDSPRIALLSGQGVSPPIVSSSNTVFIEFSSDGSLERSGFELYYYATSNETIFPNFDCFGVGNLTDGSCDCSRGFSGGYCSNIDCQDEIFDLDPYVISFDFTSNGDPTPSRAVLDSTNITFGGPVNRIRARSVDSSLAGIMVVSNELSKLCVETDELQDRRLGTISAGNEEEKGHEIVLHLNYFAFEFNVSFIYEAQHSNSSLRLLVINDQEVLSQAFVTGEEVASCRPGDVSLRKGRFSWLSNSTMTNRIEFKMSNDEVYLIDDLSISSECSSALGHSLSVLFLIIGLVGVGFLFM